MKWRRGTRLQVIAKTPANERFPRGTPVAERRLRRGTVEKLHSRAETPKGPTVVGPFDFSDFMVAGAHNHRIKNTRL